jgi:predicted nucleotide-binding protein
MFVVHGQDEAAKEVVARFSEKLTLRAVILHEQPNVGRTIIEKCEAYSDVCFAVVLFTPNDVGGIRDEATELKPRARQNVIFELGYFIGKLGSRRVCALYKEVETSSDYYGVLYVPMHNTGA